MKQNTLNNDKMTSKMKVFFFYIYGYPARDISCCWNMFPVYAAHCYCSAWSGMVSGSPRLKAWFEPKQNTKMGLHTHHHTKFSATPRQVYSV